MYLKCYLCFLFLNIIYCQNITNETVVLKWISSNFGSSFASQPSFFDLNHDGSIDMISLSVDGEIICYDLETGEPLINSNWPIYLTNDHFFSKPIMYIFGQNYNQEFILVISQKGLMYFFDWNGFLVNTLKIDNIYLNKNWSIIHYKTLSDVISLKNNLSSIELYPEIYADGMILDLNNTGISSDLVIPVNFVSKNLGKYDVIVSAVVVFNLMSKSVLTLFPLQISMNGELPGYLLTNIDLLDTNNYQLIITSTSGFIYKLEWNNKIKQFNSLFHDGLIYNIGPNKCHLTKFCRAKNDTFYANKLCCLYIDYYGHMVMMDLNSPTSMWEYEFNDGGTATGIQVFVDNYDPVHNTYAIFGTNKGWIHCVSLLTGSSMNLFPISFHNTSFSSNSFMAFDSKQRPFIMILSDDGSLYKISFHQPKEWHIIITNEEISSYLSPTILPSSKNTKNNDIIIQSKNGFIFKYQIHDLKPEESRMSKAVMNELNPKSISTLYGTGSSFSFNLKINDHVSINKSNSEYYLIKIFVNEYLYAIHKEMKSHNGITDSQIIIDLNKLDRTLIPDSVFLFGTVSVKVSDSNGQSFPTDYFFIRINYDFQFELIWIVYLTFFICIITLLTLHIYNDNHKYYIPLFEECDPSINIEN